MDDFAKELLVGCFEQFFERPNVWRTEASDLSAGGALLTLGQADIPCTVVSTKPWISGEYVVVFFTKQWHYRRLCVQNSSHRVKTVCYNQSALRTLPKKARYASCVQWKPINVPIMQTRKNGWVGNGICNQFLRIREYRLGLPKLWKSVDYRSCSKPSWYRVLRHSVDIKSKLLI